MKAARPIRSLPEAIDWARDTAREHPERDVDQAVLACLDGRRRRWPVISLGGGDPKGRESVLEMPEVDMPSGPEGDLAREIVGMLAPLCMDNPFCLNFDTGKGPGTLVTCFDIPLSPEANDTPALVRSIDDVLADPPPEPRTSGMMPEIRRRIELIQSLLPDAFKIRIADTQGPFNVAHMIVGEEALTAPYLDPERYHALMERATTFVVDAAKVLRGWIGPDYRAPRDRMLRLRECSMNLTSRQFYEDFVLPYDLRVSEALAPIDLHSCSGRHVFNETLDLLPGIAMVEAGRVEMDLAAGYTPVDMAMERIQGKPIALNIGQDLPERGEFEFIAEDLDRYRSHPRLLFHYNGIHFWRRDPAHAWTLRRELEDYWDRECA